MQGLPDADDKAMADELAEGEGGGEPDLAHMLLEHDGAALAQAMEAAGERANVAEIRLSSQRRLLTRRLLDEMGLGGLERRIAEAGKREDGAKLAERLGKAREELFAEAGRYVERQHELYAAESGRKLRDDVLANQKLTAIDEHELATMQRLVRRMASGLASKYSRPVRGQARPVGRAQNHPQERRQRRRAVRPDLEERADRLARPGRCATSRLGRPGGAFSGCSSCTACTRRWSSG